MFKGDGVGKVESWRDGVFVGDHRLIGSVTRGQVVHPGVATLDGRVAGDEEQEVKVVVDVREEELMLFVERFCEWEWE